MLETGEPVRAVIVQTQSMSAQNPAGVETYALVLRILQHGRAPRQVQIGNPVPESFIPLLYPGSNVPTRALASQPNAVSVDWDSALAEASR